MNQARKFNFKTHVEKLNLTSRTDLSNKMLHSILYWKLLFKPFPYKSFGWCNAHSVQADALWGRSFKFQMKNTPQNQYFPANAERMDVHCLESGCIGKYIPPLGSVRIHSLILSREGLILTLSILACPEGWIFPYVKQANTKMQVHKYTNTEHTTKWQRKKTCGIFLKQLYNSSNMINAESAQFTRSSSSTPASPGVIYFQ